MVAAITDQPGEALPRVTAAEEALDCALDVAGDEAARIFGGLDQRGQFLPGDALQELDGGALIVDNRGHGHE